MKMNCRRSIKQIRSFRSVGRSFVERPPSIHQSIKKKVGNDNNNNNNKETYMRKREIQVAYFISSSSNQTNPNQTITSCNNNCNNINNDRYRELSLSLCRFADNANLPTTSKHGMLPKTNRPSFSFFLLLTRTTWWTDLWIDRFGWFGPTIDALDFLGFVVVVVCCWCCCGCGFGDHRWHVLLPVGTTYYD